MSKASAWSDAKSAAQDVLGTVTRQRPGPAQLALSPKVTMVVSVKDDGTPLIKTPDAPMGYDVEADALVAFAGVIIDIFGKP